MKSFFESLSEAQKEAAKNYRGPENHGSDEFKLTNLPKFSLINTRRGDVYKIIRSSENGADIELTLDKDGERCNLNYPAARTIFAELKKVCMHTNRENPVGLEIVIEKSFYQDGRTSVLIRESK